MDWWREKKKKKQTLERGAMLLEDLIECCDGKSNPIKFFSAHQIRKATDNFSESNHVSELHDLCYKWYSGKDDNHHMILIRKPVAIFQYYPQGKFCRDIAISSMVSGHKNFMRLVGCCLEFEDPIMVYNGVKKHYKLGRILREQPWKRRMKIAEDIATSLAYLHTAFPRPFVYRCLIPDNILLDEDGVTKLSGLSFCVSIPKGETFVKVYRNYYGDIYKDIKYLRDGVVSVGTDVYAIGMLMQMLLTRKQTFYLDWVEKLNHPKERSDGYDTDDYIFETEVQRRGTFMEEGRMDEIADQKMLEMMGEISEEDLCQMKAFLRLSQRCISEVEVPTMVEVAKELKKIQRSLKDYSSSSSGETQFDSAQDIGSSVLTGLRGEVPTMGEVANEQKTIQRSLKNDYSTPSPSYEEFDSPSPSPSDEEFTLPGFEMDWWRKKKPKPNFERGAMLLEDLIECCDGKSNPIKIFSADQISEATDNFSGSNHVSELSNLYYKWYSGKNENHQMLLIRKTADKFYAYKDGNFYRDIAISLMVSGHKNSMKLVGCCLEFESPVMVYHGVKKHYLLDIREQLWKRRMKIAEDIATSLAYLHTAFPRPFVYRIMSLEKILLDEDGVAKLNDFSCCVSIPKGQTFVKVDRVEGTRCYMDYKYVRNGVVSEETDVFAIGMLMQTLLTGKRILRIWEEEGDGDGDGDGDDDGKRVLRIWEEDGDGDGDGDDDSMYFIPNWKSKFMKERKKMDEIADPIMGEISEEMLYQMKAFRMLSQICIGLRGKVPTMVEVAKELKKIRKSRLFFYFR